jgi:hypothetical protein
MRDVETGPFKNTGSDCRRHSATIYASNNPRINIRLQQALEGRDRFKRSAQMILHEFQASHPEIGFSIYTHIQAHVLIKLGTKIKSQFDSMFKGHNSIDLSQGDPYGEIWLWVIGVYEVIRTMSDPKWKSSWSKEKYSEICKYKKRIADLRVPFAKQEYRNGRAINNEASIRGIDNSLKSYLYEVEDKKFSIREEIDKFEALIYSIETKDVLKDMRDNAN